LGEWISILIPFVVMIIWVLNQVFSKLAQPGQNPGQMRRPNAPARPQQDPRVNEEIEKFLRRAAQQQQGAAREARPAEPVAAPAAPARTLGRRPDVFSAPGKSPPLNAPLVEVEIIDESPAAKSVGDHVERYFEHSQFKKRPDQFSKVDQADEDMAAHVHEVFDRQLGKLSGERSTTTAAAATMMPKPNQLVQMLRDPRSLRNAVIMHEILTPPESLWKE
jgi:hypothetical protein